MAEITTVGATYGAFGALAIGHVFTKLRPSFYNRKQVPFVFIIMALLVLDGLLSSRVLHAGWDVILNALVLPLVVAGGVGGLAGRTLSRRAFGARPIPPKMLRPPWQTLSKWMKRGLLNN